MNVMISIILIDVDLLFLFFALVSKLSSAILLKVFDIDHRPVITDKSFCKSMFAITIKRFLDSFWASNRSILTSLHCLIM